MNCDCCQNCFKEIKKFIIDRVISSLEQDRKSIGKAKVKIDKKINDTIKIIKTQTEKINLCPKFENDVSDAKEKDEEKFFVLCIKRAQKAAKDSQ